jgi:D-glycero-D-manno-heptose 1,7-bisphosphate phosphatase
MISPRDPDKVVILDRDGTIVIDRGYLAEPDGLEFMPSAPEALQWLCVHGYGLIVITNQSGVGRGLFTMDQVEAMNARLREMVEGIGARLTKIYVCPHVPDANCACRKPNLALMQQAAMELNFNPRGSVVVGDKESDVEFGARAGARTIWISPKTARAPGRIAGSLIVPTLMDAALFITDSAENPVKNVPIAASRSPCPVFRHDCRTKDQGSLVQFIRSRGDNRTRER